MALLKRPWLITKAANIIAIIDIIIIIISPSCPPPPPEAQLAFLTSAHNQKHSTWKNPSRFSSSATVIPFPAYCSRLLWLSWPKRKNTTTYTLFFFLSPRDLRHVAWKRSGGCWGSDKKRQYMLMVLHGLPLIACFGNAMLPVTKTTCRWEKFIQVAYDYEKSIVVLVAATSASTILLFKFFFCRAV